MSLYPYAGAHAVQSAAFVLEWPIDLTEAELSVVMGVHEKLRTALPISAPIQTVTFQFVANQAGSTVGAASGYVFSRLGPAGPTRVLEVHRNRMVGQVNDYTRWDPVWKEVGSWFSAVGPILGKRQITHVGLQYNDVFHWRGAPESLDLKQVFKEDSSLLPGNIFKLQGLWHSHHGYFLEQSTPVSHRLLENVNVSMLEELGQRSIVISTVHKAEVAGMWGWEKMSEHVDALMANLHSRNKAVLRELLSDDAARSIGLLEGNQ